MPHKLRSIRKKRGSRTQGYGRVAQHRKNASKGNRKVGRHKHLWSYVLRYEPDYFGKKGFVSPKSLRLKDNIINVKELDELAEKFAREQEKGKPLLDLENLGFTKLLGTGKIKKPLVIKVASFSSSAAEKIKGAGGEILGAVKEEGE
jgi:large subunit ribosomal protein L15